MAPTESRAHDFIPPDSPAGKLLAAGWPAVPDLIEAALAKETVAEQRAWALSILYGITGRNNPMDVPEILGPCEYRSSGWVVRGGYAEGSGIMGAGSGSGALLAGKADPRKQQDFAARWKDWHDKGYFKIEAE